MPETSRTSGTGGADHGATVADLGEDDLLALVFPVLAAAGERAPIRSGGIRVGPGDDAAVLDVGPGLVATTDAMVRGRDWRDEWSSGADVGAKAAVQNLADVAAMGARPVALLVTLVCDPATSVAWVLDLARGLSEVASAAGCSVAGGDLSSAPDGTLVVSVTALGALDGREPVLRSGARVGDVVAVAGSLGLADAGWRLLVANRGQADPEAVARQLRPDPPLWLGIVASDAGATSMVDLSDGLLRDAGRVAAASGVLVDLDPAAVEPDVERLRPALGTELARECVLAGGEEHSLLATFPSAGEVPEGFRVVGRVRAGRGVALDGIPQEPGGWDHFGG